MLIKITLEAAIRRCSHTVDGVPTPIPRIAWLLAVMALALWLVRRYRATMPKSDADLKS